jgi:hypothetical protein
LPTRSRHDNILKSAGAPVMIDATTQEPIVVHAEGTGGPYIMVPLEPG